MRRKELSGNKVGSFISYLIIFLLLIGIVTTIVLQQQRQTLLTKADTPSPTPITKNCTVSDSLLSISQEEQTLFDQINAYRQQQNIPPLVWSSVLKRAAAWLSNDMFTNKRLSHTDSLGRNLLTRLQDCGYTNPAAVGENLDSGTTDPLIVLSAWQHSPPHNANLLSRNFTQAAISLVKNASGSEAYWTLNLARPTATAIPSPTISPSPTPTLSHSPTPKISLSPTPTIIPIPSKQPSPTPTLYFPPTSTPRPTIAEIPTAGPPPPTPTPVPGFVLNPFDTQVLVSVQIPGIGTGGNKTPVNLTRRVDVTIYDMSNAQVLTGYGFLSYDGVNLFRGVIHFGLLENNIYYLKINSKYALQTLVIPEFQVLRNDRLNVLPSVTLTLGDLNEDGIISIVDYNIALPCFQNNRCVTKEIIDFNDDGRANVIDYNLLLHNFWKFEGD